MQFSTASSRGCGDESNNRVNRHRLEPLTGVCLIPAQ
jgi:hypothetical protein